MSLIFAQSIQDTYKLYLAQIFQFLVKFPQILLQEIQCFTGDMASSIVLLKPQVLNSIKFQLKLKELGYIVSTTLFIYS